MSLPALAGVLSAAGAVPGVGTSGLNLIGGAVGGALSGAVPLDRALSKVNSALTPVTQAFDKTATQASQLYGTFFKLKSGFDTAIGGVGALTSALKSAPLAALSGDVVAKPIRALAAGIDMLNAPALNVIGSLGKLRDSMTAVGNALTPFVQMANPAIAQRFQFASDDLTASFGKMLLPAMRHATTVTRAFADVTFALAGPVQRFGKAFDPLVAAVPRLVNALGPAVSGLSALGDAFTETVKPIIAIIGDQLGDAFDILGVHLRGFMALIEPSIKLFAQAQAVYGTGMRALTRNNLFDGLRSKGMIGGPGFSGASVGAAVRNVGFSSVEGFQNRAIQQAYGLGTANSPEEKTAQGVSDIYKWLSEKLPQLINEAPARLAAVLSEELAKLTASGSATGTAAGVVSGIGTAGRDAGRWLERAKGRIELELGDLFGRG